MRLKARIAVLVPVFLVSWCALATREAGAAPGFRHFVPCIFGLGTLDSVATLAIKTRKGAPVAGEST
jgi:hypothetical protein